MDMTDKLTNIALPPSGSDEEFARSIIEMVLNYSLNRHAHKLDESGYLKSGKYSKEGGWDGDKPNKALQLKFDLVDEAVDIFQPQIVEKLCERIKPYQSHELGFG